MSLSVCLRVHCAYLFMKMFPLWHFIGWCFCTALIFSSCTATLTLISKVSWLMFHLAIPFSLSLSSTALPFLLSTYVDFLCCCYCWVGSLQHKAHGKRSTHCERAEHMNYNKQHEENCLLQLFTLSLSLSLRACVCWKFVWIAHFWPVLFLLLAVAAPSKRINRMINNSSRTQTQCESLFWAWLGISTGHSSIFLLFITFASCVRARIHIKSFRLRKVFRFGMMHEY